MKESLFTWCCVAPVRFIICVLMLPVDLARLTVHSWQFACERFAAKSSISGEHRCPMCRDCDIEVVPRQMHLVIRYWNGWMIRLLLPHVTFYPAKKHLKKVPVCRNQSGYILAPWYSLILALMLSIMWISVIYWLGVLAG